ncbi:MAG: hypothetical protein RPU34_02480 [Candidatus Sedimenticola sp. (ex Thyasira tokunagai)]
MEALYCLVGFVIFLIEVGNKKRDFLEKVILCFALVVFWPIAVVMVIGEAASNL